MNIFAGSCIAHGLPREDIASTRVLVLSSKAWRVSFMQADSVKAVVMQKEKGDAPR